MAQYALHRLRLNLPFVHQPVRQRMTEIVKAVTVSVGNRHPGLLRSRAQMVRDEDIGTERHFAAHLKGRKQKILIPPVRSAPAPALQMTRQAGMQRHESVAALRLGRAILAARPALRHPYPSFTKPEIRPAKRQQFGGAQSRGGTGEHQDAMKRGGEGAKNAARLLRCDGDSAVACRAARLDGLTWISGHQPVQDADLENSHHYGADFRDGSPGQASIRMQPLQPALNIERFNILRDL